MVSFLDLVLGGIRVMLLIRATGCLFESLEYVNKLMLSYSLLLLAQARKKHFFPTENPREKQNNSNQSPQCPFIRVMEKSVKNAVFKGFPVLMESGPL